MLVYYFSGIFLDALNDIKEHSAICSANAKEDVEKEEKLEKKSEAAKQEKKKESKEKKEKEKKKEEEEKAKEGEEEEEEKKEEEKEKKEEEKDKKEEEKDKKEEEKDKKEEEKEKKEEVKEGENKNEITIEDKSKELNNTIQRKLSTINHNRKYSAHSSVARTHERHQSSARARRLFNRSAMSQVSTTSVKYPIINIIYLFIIIIY